MSIAFIKFRQNLSNNSEDASDVKNIISEIECSNLPISNSIFLLCVCSIALVGGTMIELALCI